MWHFASTLLRRSSRRTAVVALALAVGCAGAEQPLRIGYFSLPPHTRQADESEEQAPVVRYARQISQAMGAQQVAVAEYPLPRLLRMLESGELDMALMLAKSPARMQTLVFASQPFYIAKPVIVLSESSPIRRIERVDDMLGVRIGVRNSGYLSPLLRDERIRTQRIDGEAAAERHLHMLVAGHIDAFYSPDQCAVSHVLRSHRGAAPVRQVMLPDGDAPTYVVFSRSAAKRWSAAYEIAFARLQGRSGYARLLGRRCSNDMELAGLESADEMKVMRTGR